jgi:hypothetical protein
LAPLMVTTPSSDRPPSILYLGMEQSSPMNRAFRRMCPQKANSYYTMNDHGCKEKDPSPSRQTLATGAAARQE